MKLLNLALLCATLFVGSAQAAILESVRLQTYFGLSFQKGQDFIIHNGETVLEGGVGGIQWDYVDGALTYIFTGDTSLNFVGKGVHDPSIPAQCAFEAGQRTCNWIVFVSLFGDHSAGDTKTFPIRVIPEPGVVLFSVFGITLVLIRRWPRSVGT